MTFQSKSNNKKLMEELTGVIKSGDLHHAYILEGPGTANKKEFAKSFVQAIMCREQPGIGCGRCSTCRKIQNDNHVDVMAVEATFGKNSKVKSVRDGDIVEIQKQLRSKPYDGDRHIAVISDADRITARAYNRLLKTLEEPPEGTVIMLLSENIMMLPQTVISRAVHLRLMPEEHAKSGRAGQMAEEIKKLIDEKEPYYKIKKSIESAAKGKDNDRELLFLMLDCMEEMYRNDLTDKSGGGNKEYVFNAIYAVENARKEISEKITTSYSLKNMALTIGG